MWILEDLGKGTTYVLPCNKAISVGRKNVDIVVSGDSSVSRNHATVHIVHSTEDINKANGVGQVKLEDSSKFGTTVKKGCNRPADIKVNRSCELRPNDQIEFGVQGSVFKLTKRDFNVASSMLDNPTKAELQEALRCIGGNFITNWHSDVTHLVVQSFKLNLKAVRALANQCHIVTPAFVLNLKQEIATKFDKVVIDPGKYLPTFDEPSLSVANSCLLLNDVRKSVFGGKKFIFLDEKQSKRMRSVIVSGGGEVLQPVDVGNLVVGTNTCCVKPSKSSEVRLAVSVAKMAEIENELSRAGRRMIEEYEIGLAVLYCDSTVYCNSVFDLNSQNAYTQATVAESQKENPATQSLGKDSVDVPAIKKESNQHDQKYPEVRQSRDSLKLPQYSECETLEKEDMEIDCKDTVKTKVTTAASLDSVSNTLPQNTCNMKEPSLPITTRMPTEIDSVSSIPQKNKLPGTDIQETYDLKESSLPTVTRVPTEIDSSVPQINKLHGTGIQTSSSSVPSWTAKNNTSTFTSESRDLFEKEQRNLSETKISKEQVQPFVNTMNRQVSPCLVVEKGLLARRKRPLESDIVIGVKNFKRFRKVWPTYMSVHMSCSTVPSFSAVPRIIGGSDLFVNGEVEDLQFASQTRYAAESQDSNPFLCG